MWLIPDAAPAATIVGDGEGALMKNGRGGAWRLLVAMLATLALVAGACGSDDATEDDAAPAVATTAAVEDTAAPAEEAPAEDAAAERQADALEEQAEQAPTEAQEEALEAEADRIEQEAGNADGGMTTENMPNTVPPAQ